MSAAPSSATARWPSDPNPNPNPNQVAKWRRGTTDEPPPAPKDTPELADRKYAGVPVPLSESLEQCSARMLPFLHDVLLRDVRVAVDARDAQEVSSSGDIGEI